jgi:hypothetical protein
MHAVASPRLWSFSRGEWLFLLAAIAGWGLLAVLLGKDVGWDFLNYHWYVPYALLNGRWALMWRLPIRRLISIH